MAELSPDMKGCVEVPMPEVVYWPDFTLLNLGPFANILNGLLNVLLF